MKFSDSTLFPRFVRVLLFSTMFSISMNAQSFYDIPLTGIDGKAINLASYKGKKILIVNVASECGYTPQYERLQDLYETFYEKLVVIGCPSNDFGGQEPGTPAEIVTFCKKNYGVGFPLTEKLGITKIPTLSTNG